jgi:hypothetical protein
MRSVTKSVVSLAVGIATDRRLIGGVNQWILNFFPEFGIFFGIAATLTAQPKNCTPPECSARLRCRFSRVVDQDQGILLGPLDLLALRGRIMTKCRRAGGLSCTRIFYFRRMDLHCPRGLSTTALRWPRRSTRASSVLRYASRSRPFQ